MFNSINQLIDRTAIKLTGDARLEKQQKHTNTDTTRKLSSFLCPLVIGFYDIPGLGVGGLAVMQAASVYFYICLSI